MRQLPRDIECERQIIDCLLLQPATETVDPLWFYSEGRGTLSWVCEFCWEKKLFHFARPFKSSRLALAECERVAHRNAGLLLDLPRIGIGPWSSTEQLALEIDAIRESNGVAQLFGQYVRRVRELSQLRDAIAVHTRRLKAAWQGNIELGMEGL